MTDRWTKVHREGKEELCKEGGREVQRKNCVFIWNMNEMKEMKFRNRRDD